MWRSTNLYKKESDKDRHQHQEDFNLYVILCVTLTRHSMERDRYEWTDKTWMKYFEKNRTLLKEHVSFLDKKRF